jgi:hypothetical protein
MADVVYSFGKLSFAKLKKIILKKSAINGFCKDGDQWLINEVVMLFKK